MALVSLLMGGLNFSQHGMRQNTQDLPLLIFEERLEGMNVTEGLLD